MNRLTAPSRLRLAGDDLIQTAIRLGLLAVLLYWSFTLVRPFVPIFAWAVVLAVALYPVYDWLAERLGNRRRLTAVVITLACFAVVVGPTIWLGAGLARGLQLAAGHFESGLPAIPPPPDSVKEWPVIGPRAHELWMDADVNIKSAIREIVPSKALAGTALAAAGSLGTGMLKFFAALVLAGFLFAPAPHLVNAARAFLLRVIPHRSEELVALAGATIRGVSQGVIGLSILYALLTGLGLQLAGVPGASTLAFIILLLNILQIGPVLITVPVVIWAWMVKDPPAALLLTTFMLAMGVLEGVLKPIMMGRGLKTPTLVILIGAFGGTLAHGMIGLFVGPVILAVGWALAAAWVAVEKADLPEPGESAAGMTPTSTSWRSPLHP